VKTDLVRITCFQMLDLILMLFPLWCWVRDLQLSPASCLDTLTHTNIKESRLIMDVIDPICQILGVFY